MSIEVFFLQTYSSELKFFSGNRSFYWPRKKPRWSSETRSSKEVDPVIKKGKKGPGHVDNFCQKLGITPYTLENYPNFKNKTFIWQWKFLKINNYRTKRKLRFNEFSEIIQTLLNQDFRFNKSRSRLSLWDVKGMCDKVLKLVSAIFHYF